jgi:hypothetical protein
MGNVAPEPSAGPPVTIEIAVKVQAVPAIPGCTTMGVDLDDARANAIEAAEGCLEVAYDRNRDQAIRDMTE